TEVFQLVGAQYPVVLRAGFKLAQRIDGVAGPAAFYLYGIDAQTGVLAYGDLQHRQPVLAAGGQGLALPGVGGWDQLHMIEPQRLPGAAGQADMGQVHGIEAAAQQSDSYSHARGFRKSDSAASGVPSAGVQL